jgi:hypothetical protein
MKPNVFSKYQKLGKIYNLWRRLQSNPHYSAAATSSSHSTSEGCMQADDFSSKAGPSNQLSRYLLTPPLSEKEMYTASFEDPKEISDWLDGVVSFPIEGQPEHVGVISWLDDELPCPPRATWHDWSPPLTTSDHRQFSGNDHSWSRWLCALPWAAPS